MTVHALAPEEPQLSLTLILGVNIIYCKPKNLENVGLAVRESESSQDKVSI